MATQIEKKVQQLRSKNFDLGNPVTAEVNCGYGGRMQTFANATIYYHPVMGSEAHEVHGGIRTKYLALGGHDVSPASGQRLFGFPLSDEKDSDDITCRVSRFEWGSIYWIYGCTYVYGKIYEEYLKLGGEKGMLGYPIAEPVALSDGLVIFFEHGCMYYGTRSHSQVLQINYTFPQLGHPWMIAAAQVPDKEVISFGFFKSLINFNIAGHLVEEIFNGRLFLKETAGSITIPLVFNFTDMKQRAGVTPTIDFFGSVMRLQDGAALKNKRLYDIILKFPNRTHAVGAHSVYIRDSWKDFNFIHATDIHVSRRVDGFRKFFRDRSMDDAVRNFNNFNDNFREFIHYANSLHREGKLDFIMITGDLVDYVFEDGGKSYYTNNFVYFENIVRGLTGKPDQAESEELVVPILTSLGNHDYRTRPYYPLFTVDVTMYPDFTMEQFGSFNITHDEADLLTKEHLGIKNGKVSSDTATDMIKPDRNNQGGNLNYYYRNINRDPSYVVTLGDHKVIMIDGKWDDGTIEGTKDAILWYLGLKGEATDNFKDGSPDSVGFVGTEFNMISRALQDNGLVIIGMHDPAINPKNSEYSWYLRESVRAANPQPYTPEIRRYLFRQDPKPFINYQGLTPVSIDLTKNIHTDWLRQHTFYFYEGNAGDLLDYGVMRGGQEDFLKLITGVKNSPRPADLILSGHVHKNWECRLLWNAQSGKFQVSHEFFTENPATYYHSYDTALPGDKFPLTQPSYPGVEASILKSGLMRIHVELTEAAAVDEKPVRNSSGVWSIKTKPYPLTLNSQKDNAHCKWWWGNVRPLLIQTAALGPSEYLRAPEHQPDFRGCRLISVAADTIEKISYITHDAIKNAKGNSLLDVIGEVRDFHVLVNR